MCPNSIYFGLKVVPKKVLWGQRLYYLGTWVFRLSDSAHLSAAFAVRSFGFKGLGSTESGLDLSKLIGV